MSEATTAPERIEPLQPLGGEERHRRRRSSLSDPIYWTVLYGVAAVFVALTVALLYFTIDGSLPAWRQSGFGLLTGTTWDPGGSPPQYGALPLIVGTLETSGIALFFGVPIGILAALAIVH